MNNKAFTLLELLMVVIIIGILATWAVPQYEKFKEKVYAVEAINTMGIAMRKMKTHYFLISKVAADVVNSVADELAEGKYWYYGRFGGGDPNAFDIIAFRSDGAYSGKSVTLRWDCDADTLEWSGEYPFRPQN